MRETYDIIIEKLERDKERFDKEIFDIIDELEYKEFAKVIYLQCKTKKDYCMDLIEFFEEVRDNL